MKKISKMVFVSCLFFLLSVVPAQNFPKETQDNYPLYEDDCNTDFPEISVKRWRELDFTLYTRSFTEDRFIEIGDFVGSLFQRRFTKITFNSSGLSLNTNPLKKIVDRFAERSTNKLFHPEVEEFTYYHSNSNSYTEDNILPLIHEIVKKFRSIKKFTLDLSNNEPIYAPIYFNDYYQQPSKSPIFSAFQHVKTLEKFSLKLDNWVDITALELSWFGHSLKDTLTTLELSLSNTQIDAASLARITPMWENPLVDSNYLVSLNFKNQAGEKIPHLLTFIEKIMSRKIDYSTTFDLSLNLANTGITKTSELDRILTAILPQNINYQSLELDLSSNDILVSEQTNFVARVNDIVSFFSTGNGEPKNSLVLNLAYCNLYNFEEKDLALLFEPTNVMNLKIDLSGNLDISPTKYTNAINKIDLCEINSVQSFAFKLPRTYDDCSNQDYSLGHKRLMEVINIKYPGLQNLLIDLTNDDKVVDATISPIVQGNGAGGAPSHLTKSTSSLLQRLELQLGGTEIQFLSFSDFDSATELVDLTINLSNTPYVDSSSNLEQLAAMTWLEKLNLDFSNLNNAVTGTQFANKINAILPALTNIRELRLNYSNNALTQAELAKLVSGIQSPNLEHLEIDVRNIGDYSYDPLYVGLIPSVGFAQTKSIKISLGTTGAAFQEDALAIAEILMMFNFLKTVEFNLVNIKASTFMDLIVFLDQGFNPTGRSLEVLRLSTDTEICEAQPAIERIKKKLKEFTVTSSYVEP